MRVTPVIAFIVGALPFIAFAGEGNYCVIPKLVQGQPSYVDVPYIDKPFCGMALIDRHYVQLSEVTKAQEESKVTCTSEAACEKTARYYLDEKKETEPYIIIFHGPMQPKSS